MAASQGQLRKYASSIVGNREKSLCPPLPAPHAALVPNTWMAVKPNTRQMFYHMLNKILSKAITQ